MTDRKFVNTSSTPQDTSDGRVFGPGETISVKDVDDYILMKVDAGLLVEVVEPTTKGGKD